MCIMLIMKMALHLVSFERLKSKNYILQRTHRYVRTGYSILYLLSGLDRWTLSIYNLLEGGGGG
jgi:hypothetical protein